MSLDLALIEQLREFETALVANAISAMGGSEAENYYTGNDVKLLTGISGPLVGVAHTLVADTSTPKNVQDTDGLFRSYDLIQESPLPVVVVMKAIGSRPNHECILGDGMAKIFKSYGSCGLITDGGVRDVAGINNVGYPVFGSGTVSDHCKMMYKLSEEPVYISGVSFASGDLVHADQDGVLIIPAKFHISIVEACILTRDYETRVHVYWRRSDKRAEEKKKYAERMAKEHHVRCQALLSS